MAKITQIQVWIIGAVLILITGVVIFFALIRPAQERLTAANQKWDTNNAIVITDAEKKRDRQKALKEVAEAERDWRRYDARYMPNINMSNLYNAMRQLWDFQIKRLGPEVDQYLRQDKSVQLLQAGFQLPAPPTDPNQVNRPYYVYDLGNVSVMGTFENVLNHASRWNNFNRLVLMDGLTLSGNSPNLVGTYNLRCFIFTRGTDKPGEAWPVAGGTTGGGFGGPPGGFGGYGGGPPGGFPGGVPGGGPNVGNPALGGGENLDR